MIKVAPSILSGDFAAMGKTVADVESWGADWIHFDVMDGIYVPNITFGMPMCRAIRKHTTLPLDVHLMITKPERYVEEFCRAGADIVTFHPDASEDVRGTLLKIQALGKKAGLVLSPDKGTEWIAPYLDIVDMILIMGVYPGFGGQKLIEASLEKAREVYRMIQAQGRQVDLELDGGVTLENAREIVGCGVNVLVAGSSVFNHSNPSEAVQILRNL